MRDQWSMCWYSTNVESNQTVMITSSSDAVLIDGAKILSHICPDLDCWYQRHDRPGTWWKWCWWWWSVSNLDITLCSLIRGHYQYHRVDIKYIFYRLYQPHSGSRFIMSSLWCWKLCSIKNFTSFNVDTRPMLNIECCFHSAILNKAGVSSLRQEAAEWSRSWV